MDKKNIILFIYQYISHKIIQKNTTLKIRKEIV